MSRESSGRESGKFNQGVCVWGGGVLLFLFKLFWIFLGIRRGWKTYLGGCSIGYCFLEWLESLKIRACGFGWSFLRL
jgi:hypothetical protein